MTSKQTAGKQPIDIDAEKWESMPSFVAMVKHLHNDKCTESFRKAYQHGYARKMRLFVVAVARSLPPSGLTATDDALLCGEMHADNIVTDGNRGKFCRMMNAVTATNRSIRDHLAHVAVFSNDYIVNVGAGEEDNNFFKWDDFPNVANIFRDIVGNPHIIAEHVDSYIKYDQCVNCLGSSYNQRGPCSLLRPEWLTDAVRGIAAQAYNNQHYIDSTLINDRLAVLSDALEEAGCPHDKECPECSGRGWLRSDLDDLGECWKVCRACGGSRRTAGRLLSHLRSSKPHYRGCWALDYILRGG